jgi:hypothetical protein
VTGTVRRGTIKGTLCIVRGFVCDVRRSDGGESEYCCLVGCVAEYTSVLKMNTARSYETLVNLNHPTR